MNKNIIISGLALFLVLGNGFYTQAQSAKQTRVYIKNSKNSDGSRSVVATLRYREKNYVALPGEELSFYQIIDTAKVFLGSVKTDSDGMATYTVDKDSDSEMGAISTFAVEYEGNSTYKISSNSATVKDANMELSFYQKDEIKYIQVEVSETVDDEIVPLEEMYIMFYVQGSFSLLNIGEEETNDEGTITIEFPTDIPGDLNGELSIIARIEDHDDYGWIESSGKMNWGTPIAPVTEKHRGLGDTDAPLWMVYTLIFLLSAVWFHYMYVLFMIFKIRMDQNNARIEQLMDDELTEA